MNETTQLIYTIAGIAFLPAIIWMIIVGVKVKTTFARYNVQTRGNFTAEQVARLILDRAGLQDVNVMSCYGNLTDHFDPKSNTVFLSETVYGRSTVSAIGVAAHECGHAIQFAEEYAPLKLRSFLVPIVNFTSRYALILIIAGLFLEMLFALGLISNILMFLGIIFYACYTFFTLITLPVEKNASRRAQSVLEEEGILDKEELGYSKKVLNAAANTYVASFLVSFLQLIRLISLTKRRR